MSRHARPEGVAGLDLPVRTVWYAVPPKGFGPAYWCRNVKMTRVHGQNFTLAIGVE